jgi:hypothetical protein
MRDIAPMRTVICYLTECSERDVASVLDANFVVQNSGPWLLLSSSGDPILYVNFYDPNSELGPDEISAIRTALGGTIQVSVSADVSGRHVGAVEAARFALALLSQFRGVAVDDFSDHLWTRSEIEQQAVVDGRCFFQSQGLPTAPSGSSA